MEEPTFTIKQSDLINLLEEVRIVNSADYNDSMILALSMQKEVAEKVVAWKKKEKPPLGLEPRRIWESKRVDAVCAAISRYIADRKPIPKEWIEEYNEVSK